MKRIIMAMTISLIFISSCATQRLMLVRGSQTENATLENSQAFFVYGIAQTQKINVNQACAGRTPVALDVTYSPLDVILRYITVGIYSPRTVKVYCR